MQDRTLQVLSVAAIVSLAIGIYEAARDSESSEHKYAWVEGLAIIFASKSINLIVMI
jgi:hypothetical protein